MSLTEVQFADFKWFDYTNPSEKVLQQIAIDLNISEAVLLNCLNTDYLPHIETYGATQFIVLRLMEPQTKLRASSVQELTTKIALFIHPQFLITLHRLPLAELHEIREQLKQELSSDITKQKLLTFFYEQVSLGFDKPLAELEQKLDGFEQTLFNKKKPKNFLQEGFYLKRKASAFKKVLKLSLDLMSKLVLKVDCSVEHFQQSRDRLERSLFYAEDVYENIQSLLNLHVAIESQKTNEASYRANEIMRVLTVSTIFFLPLNFIAGVYGMNFDDMPLLKSDNGFWIAVLGMTLVSLGLWLYLLYQGWLRKPDIDSYSDQQAIK